MTKSTSHSIAVARGEQCAVQVFAALVFVTLSMVTRLDSIVPSDAELDEAKRIVTSMRKVALAAWRR